MFPFLDLQYSFYKVLYINPVHIYKTLPLTTHDQDQTSDLNLQTAPGSDFSILFFVAAESLGV